MLKVKRRVRLTAKSRSILLDVICYLFMALFLYAAVNKLLDFEKFKAQIGQSAMLTNYAGILAWAVPAVEIGIAVLLFIPKTITTGLYASFTLMVIFSAYIGIMLSLSEHISCNCGGILKKMSWQEHLVFNVVFMGLGGVGIMVETKLSRLPGP
jgi:uncharacterized membrane protein YphA (DoxX/SURF4 family)